MSSYSVTDYTKDGMCSDCGACCSDLIPISVDEIATIRRYICKHNIKENRHNVMVGVDLTCPFRDEANRRCTIYPVRPMICRQFMCNHTAEDIRRAKWMAMEKYQPVCMRSTFYGNAEETDFFLALNSMVQMVQTRK